MQTGQFNWRLKCWESETRIEGKPKVGHGSLRTVDGSGSEAAIEILGPSTGCQDAMDRRVGAAWERGRIAT